MNRDTVFKALKQSDCDWKWVWKYNTKFIEFSRNDEWYNSFLYFNDSVITDWYSIWVCRPYLIVKGRYDELDIRLKYSDINNIEIRGNFE